MRVRESKYLLCIIVFNCQKKKCLFANDYWIGLFLYLFILLLSVNS